MSTERLVYAFPPYAVGHMVLERQTPIDAIGRSRPPYRLARVGLGRTAVVFAELSPAELIGLLTAIDRELGGLANDPGEPCHFCGRGDPSQGSTG